MHKADGDLMGNTKHTNQWKPNDKPWCQQVADGEPVTAESAY
jgi:hypothetical protein